MNDAPMKQPDVNQTDGAELQPTELRTPHFDDIAVAVAQPVEPIMIRAHHRYLAALMEKPWTVLPIVFITAMIGIAALALSVQLPDQDHIDTAATEIIAATEIEAEQTSTEPEPQVAADAEPPKSHPRRTVPTKARARNNDGSKPVARRVGVIFYGRSDRP